MATTKSPSPQPVKTPVPGADNKAYLPTNAELDRYNQIIPETTLTTTKPDGTVHLRLSAETAQIVPQTVFSMLCRQARKTPQQTALRVKRNNKWQSWTYADYHRDVVRTAKSFIKLGLEPTRSVGILGFNAPEWFLSDLGAIVAGGFAVGIYTTNSTDACLYVAKNSRCNIIVVENDHHLERILQIRDQLPELKAIVQYIGDVEPHRLQSLGDGGVPPHLSILSWQQFLSHADNVSDDVLKSRLEQQAPNKGCTIIYTSGTTGNPKGAMLSHDNLLFTATTSSRGAGMQFTAGAEVYISYLPLSHIAAQITDIYMPLVTAGCVNFAQPDALKGSLGDTLRECRPTAILGVPRVWEKIQEKLQTAGRESGQIKRAIGTWAKSIGLRGNRARLEQAKPENASMPWGWSLAKLVVFDKVRQLLGLDRCRLCATGAAPIMLETLEYFLSLDIPLYEIYGMSESTGPHSATTPYSHRLQAVGRTLAGCRTRIDKPDKDGNGEICMLGRNIFMGYLGMPEKTQEAIDADGWLHSGDIGRLDSDGFLFITGRLKELIKTSGGENIAPVPIEDMLKEQCPFLSNAMLIGDRRKFLSVLVTLKCVIEPENLTPTDELLPLARDLLQQQLSVNGENAVIPTTVNEARQRKDVRALIWQAIERTNKQAVSRASRIAKFDILPRDFSMVGGELGPTMKLRRPIVTKMYAELIDKLYSEPAGSNTAS